MIQNMNKFSMSWMAKGLLFLVVLSFLIWGVTDWLGPRMRQDTVARIGGETITKEMLYRATHARMTQLPQETRSELQKQPEFMKLLTFQVLKRLIQDAAMKQELKSLGISISDEFLKEVISSRPEFQDAGGHFSKEKFEAFLRHNRLSERTFLSYEREYMRSLFLRRAIALKESSVPEVVLAPLKKQLREQRSVLFVEIPAHIFPVVTSPSEATLRNYYEDNPERFRLPEVRDLSMVLLTEKEVQKSHPQTPDQKSSKKHPVFGDAAYDQDNELYDQTILIQNRLAEGESLKTIAQEMHLRYASIEGVTREGTSVTGEPIKDPSGLFTPKVIEQAFEFGEGNESELMPLEGKTYYMVMVEKIAPSSLPSYEDAKGEVLKQFQDEERLNKAQQRAQKIVERVQKGEKLEAIARKEHLSLRVISGMSLLAPKPSPSQEVLIKSFSLPVGGVSWMLGSKGACVFQVQQILSDRIPESEPSYKKAVETLVAEFAGDLENSYLESLEEELSLTINQKAFQAVVEAF